ncbi:MAG TPA: hypothetical protein VGC30_15535, partial [Dokdonella sp.]
RGPYTVEVQADGHADGGAMVALAAGAQSTLDVDLRALRPCLATDPAALQASVAAGGRTQQRFDLLNLGAAATDWTLRPGGDPAVLSSVALSQTTSPTPEQYVSFGCVDPSTGYSLPSHYYRVFPLGGRADATTLVGGLTFGVDSATSAAGVQPVVVRLHQLVGALDPANLSLLAERTVQVQDMTLQRIGVALEAPVRVAADAVLVAEIEVQRGRETGSAFFPGGNTQGETAPAYWMASDCGVPAPTAYADLGFASVNLILEIDTLASAPCGATATPVDWLAVAPASGTIGVDASTPVQATFDAGAAAAGDYSGTLCATPGPAGAPLAIPVALHVGAGGDTIFRDGFE